MSSRVQLGAFVLLLISSPLVGYLLGRRYGSDHALRERRWLVIGYYAATAVCVAAVASSAIFAPFLVFACGLYLLAFSGPIIGFIFFMLGYANRDIFEEGHCSKCGYDLTGNESGICPECGTPLSPPSPKQ